MKVSEFRKLIREEVRKTLQEGSLVKMNLYALRQSEDGNFHGTQPIVYIEASTEQRAKQLADEYTNGQFTQYSGFYNLKKSTLQVYK